jgi:hypothetical protein
VAPVPDTELPVRRYFEALNAGSLERVLAGYMANAALVTAERTRVDRGALEEYFLGLFEDLSGATFTIQSMSGQGNSREVRWTAQNDRAQVLDGEDIFGVLEGVIVYHFTHYTLTPTPDATLVPAAEAELVTA